MEDKTYEVKQGNKKPVQQIAQSYYARKDVQEAIYEFCKNRETIPRYLEGFGKRPDTLDFASDILNLAKKGATSLHCSEEIWRDPLQISTDATPEQLNQIKIGWDFLIDIDSKYLDYSKIAAELIIKALEYHGVKNIGIKFSGSKGFHIIVPWKAFPQEIDDELIKDKFPEYPRLIAAYIGQMIQDKLDKKILDMSDIEELKKTGKTLQEAICKKCENIATEQKSSKYVCPNPKCRAEMQSTTAIKSKLRCPSCNGDMHRISKNIIFVCTTCNTNSQKSPNQFEKRKTIRHHIDAVDIILVAPRHLFRVPYSLHEKTALASVVLEKHEIQDFQPHDANPLKIKIKNFLPQPEKEEARELLLQAIDWEKRTNTNSTPKKKFTGKSIDVKNLTITEDMFPNCIKYILKGIKQDGRKRALFILFGFFSSLEFPQEYIEEKLEKWNKKNHKPLRDGYIKSQISWFTKNKILPPNCDKPHYKELGAQCISCQKQGIKNPINYTIKQAMRTKTMTGKSKPMPKQKPTKP